LKNNIESIEIIKGNKSSDNRGTIFYNNNFDLQSIRRSYIIENINESFLRGWKGHIIESRWFLCSKGSIQVYVTPIEESNKLSNQFKTYELNDSEMNILYVPPGFATLIKQNIKKSRCMAFSNCLIGESKDDELRWPNNTLQL
jgi:dTDP-4-dehydrorhamnose 3,5-epimerase-like enzyme